MKPDPQKALRPIELVLSRLDDVRKNDTGYNALCPAHADSNPSLSVSEAEDGTVLLYCHAGCTCRKIVRALKLEEKDLFPQIQAKPKRRKKRPSAGEDEPKAESGRRPARKKAKTPTKKAAKASTSDQRRPKSNKKPKSLEPRLVTAKGAEEDWALFTSDFKKQLEPRHLRDLAKELGVSTDALERLHVGCSSRRRERRDGCPSSGPYR
jgi:hypothetical protein